MIEYECPECGAAMSSLVYMAGQDETCPDCGSDATVPGRATVEPTEPPTSQMQLPKRKSVSLLGIVSLILGILAVLGCWFPALIIYSILLAALGFIFGAIGFFAALIGRKAGTGTPAGGVLVCIVAMVISLYLLYLYLLYLYLWYCLQMLYLMLSFFSLCSVITGG